MKTVGLAVDVSEFDKLIDSGQYHIYTSKVITLRDKLQLNDEEDCVISNGCKENDITGGDDDLSEEEILTPDVVRYSLP
ncbi:hypothetical protein HDU76_007640 [Blyttiomyces sp. JEL0837]|nr:hypothetical protein HDU76_007640 [Blyttiomyces sp. JEL0837]